MQRRDPWFSSLYRALLRMYGLQGWWPVHGSCTHRGYHPGDYSVPHNSAQRFEICVGAILTQNTAWTNVEKAITNLHTLHALTPEKLLHLKDRLLKAAIRPAGYYTMKAKKLQDFTRFFLALRENTPSREELLSLWGIGPETADSILLYAYHCPEFVIDTYTRRILLAHGRISEKTSYNEIKALFENNVKRDVPLYQEYHALIVAHGKDHPTKGACAWCNTLR